MTGCRLRKLSCTSLCTSKGSAGHWDCFLLPFPFSSSSPGDPKALEETLVAASLLHVRVDNDVWLYLARWALSWTLDGRHVTRSRSSETPAGFGTGGPLPSAAQQRAVARLLDATTHPMPYHVRCSAFFRSWLDYDYNRKCKQVLENETKRRPQRTCRCLGVHPRPTCGSELSNNISENA